jgi:hypothetical protein
LNRGFKRFRVDQRIPKNKPDPRSTQAHDRPLC